MVSLSKRNKRTSLHQKYKVAKKVRQHHKDVKKSLKNKKPKKETTALMQIPMELPFKNEILKEVETTNQIEKETEKKRMAALRLLKKIDPVSDVDKLKEKLVRDSSRAFIGDIRKLIEDSDVILIVLDARDPMGTRSIESENLIKTANKTIIFLLNKIDLVPGEVLKGWLAYLSKEARTFPFKASCQGQVMNLGNTKAARPSSDMKGTAAAYGVDNVINYLKSLNKKAGGATAPGKAADKLVVGVAGVPNTGKSSVVNSLKRKRICEAGAKAGLTRALQRVALDSRLDLIDSPGIVLAAAADPAEHALRNCVRVEKLEDPVAVAELVFRRCDPVLLQRLYKLQHFQDVTEFMLAFATRLCPLKKGGLPNLRLASIKLINDWNSGKIAYYTPAPQEQHMEGVVASAVLSAEEERALAEFSLKSEFVQPLVSSNQENVDMDQ